MGGEKPTCWGTEVRTLKVGQKVDVGTYIYLKRWDVGGKKKKRKISL